MSEPIHPHTPTARPVRGSSTFQLAGVLRPTWMGEVMPPLFIVGRASVLAVSLGFLAALLGLLAVLSLGGTPAVAQDWPYVTPREQVPYCAKPHHHHWIQACGRAILAVEPEEEDGGTIKSWTPEGAFAEAFVSRCAEILPGAADPHDPEECPCTRAEHAEWLQACGDDFHEVEPGMRRRQVEEPFPRDGGAVMGGNLRLVHPDCQMLKLDVAYELEPGGSFMEEPEALVISVGEPYLEYLVTD